MPYGFGIMISGHRGSLAFSFLPHQPQILHFCRGCSIFPQIVGCDVFQFPTQQLVFWVQTSQRDVLEVQVSTFEHP